MALADLLATLERRSDVTPETPCNSGRVTAKPLQHKAVTLVTRVTPQIANTGKDAPIGGTAATSWGWRVTYPDGQAFAAYIVPLQTLAEVRAIHPGATVEPIPEDKTTC